MKLEDWSPVVNASWINKQTQPHLDHKISFDFDDTLSEPNVQRYAHMLVMAGYDIYITTSRMSNERAANPSWNADLEMVADVVGIPPENIHYCNLTPKHDFFKKNDDFVLHLDDDMDDVDGINYHCKITKGILFVDTFTDESLKQVTNLLKELCHS